MKKIIILLICLALSFCTLSCGGGASSSSSPPGENPGTPSLVQLQPSHFIAQTNSVITLHGKVLDGNGKGVRNVPVRFTNLSSTGILSETTAKTNDSGIATVTLKSTTVGFSTLQAEVNSGVAIVRDRKTVFFSSISIGQPSPTLNLTVSGSGNPFTLFENTNDNEVIVTATVFNGFGLRVAGIDVLFGSDSSEATFPLGSIVSTDTNGQASVLVKVIPSELRILPTVLNITALAENGAFNMVSLTLEPVTIQTINVFANPTTIESGGTSTITAQVLTNTGSPAPDGTTVNFTVSPSSSGGIDPFAQTTDGIAEAEFTAAEVTSDTTATVKASVGAIFKTVPITITAPPVEPPPAPALTVTPTTASVSCTAGGDRTFVVAGGVAPYKVTSSNPNVTLVGASGTPPTVTINASGGPFTATVAASSCGSFPGATTTVPLVVTDSASTVASATLTVTNP